MIDECVNSVASGTNRGISPKSWLNWMMAVTPDAAHKVVAALSYKTETARPVNWAFNGLGNISRWSPKASSPAPPRNVGSSSKAARTVADDESQASGLVVAPRKLNATEPPSPMHTSICWTTRLPEVYGSSPLGHSTNSQFGPQKPVSQSQPCIMVASHALYVWTGAEKGGSALWKWLRDDLESPRSLLKARSLSDRQTPLPVHNKGPHARLSQAAPSKPTPQTQVPPNRSQLPLLEHSAGWWPTPSPVICSG